MYSLQKEGTLVRQQSQITSYEVIPNIFIISFPKAMY